MDPLADSSYVMITEALRRGYTPWKVELDGLSLRGTETWANAQPIGLEEISRDRPPGDPWAPRMRALGAERPREAASFRAIVMRKDPPFDQDYLTATWWLDRAARVAVVVNAPAGLRELSEKLSILPFPELTPRTFMMRRVADLRDALRELGGRMIVKPLYGHGGRGVLFAREGDANLNTLLELATEEGRAWTIAQEFVPEASKGDKRILLVEGEPVGAVLRVPAKGELRNNFHVGGTAAKSELSPRDLEICAAVGPYVRSRGQLFVGIDVLGDYLTEINVTSPTGMQEVNRLGGLTGDATMQAKFWDALERRIAKSAPA